MDSLWYKFEMTFIVEKRYLFFLDGLKMTLLLTLASFFFGTLFGILLCAARRSKNNIIAKTAKAFSSIFIELPTLVLLMILVYVIFGNTSLPVVLIAIFGFSLKSGSYLSVIFLTSIGTVAEGEIEAARTLGMTKWQAFRYVTLPQTVKIALPLYQNQFIATLQETSIVGFLAVIDLTRASTVVSSRTMDALFGVIAIAIVYFAIGRLGKFCISLIGKHSDRTAAE